MFQHDVTMSMWPIATYRGLRCRCSDGQQIGLQKHVEPRIRLDVWAFIAMQLTVCHAKITVLIVSRTMHSCAV